MDRRVAPALVAALLALAAAAFPGSTATTGERPAPATDGDRKLFFAMHIADEHGSVLAQPRLLGLSDVPLEMTLAEPGNLGIPRLSLRLEPAPLEDGSFEIAYELEVPRLAAHGTGVVRMRPGEEKWTRVEYPGGHLEVQLAAFAVPSAEFDLYLEHGIRLSRQGPGRT